MNIRKNIFKSAIAAAFVLVLNSASAQQPMDWPTSYETGSITSDYCVSIDVTKPIVEFYKIDITALNFATETDAKKVFGSISNNYLTYRVDFANQAVYLQVHTNRTQNMQDVTWWNNYLADRCNN